MTNNLNQQTAQYANPGIKQSGAPVPFSPQAQTTMSGVFGNPITNSYDRSISNDPSLGVSNNINAQGGIAPPVPTMEPIVPSNNLY
jgi:hypothetical protein